MDREIASTPRPPTVGEGAIGDVEGAHGDAHENQELKEPKPMVQKWVHLCIPELSVLITYVHKAMWVRCRCPQHLPFH